MHTTEVEMLLEKAAKAQENGSVELAVIEYEKLLEINPDELDALRNLAKLYSFKDQPRKSAELLIKAAKVAPDNPEVLTSAGEILAKLGNYEEALEHYKEAEILRPDDIYINRSIANIYRAMGKFKDAAAKLLSKPDALKTDYDELLELAGDLKMLARYEQALELFQDASTLRPDELPPLKGIYDCQIKLGNKDKATAALKKAVLLKRNDQTIIAKLAETYATDGQFAEAAKTLKDGIENIGDAPILKQKLEEISRRLPVLKKKNAPSLQIGEEVCETEVFDILDSLYAGDIVPKRALYELEMLRHKHPGDSLVVRELAALYLQSGAADRAAEIYSELVLTYPVIPKFRVDLSRALAASGDIDAATATITSAKEELGNLHELEIAHIELCILNRNMPEADRRLEAYLNELPDDPHALFLYAYTALRRGKFRISEMSFEKILTLGKQDEEVLLWYSRLALLTGEHDKAIKAWRTLDDGFTSLVEVVSVAELLIAAGRFDEVPAELAKIGEYAPNFIEDHLLFAKAFFYAADFNTSQKELEFVLKMSNEHPEALAMAAISALIKFKVAKFSVCWRQALQIDSLYAILPFVVLKETLGFSHREKIKNEIRKMLRIATLPQVARERLMALGDIF
ncbi:MAG: tetratricopeptide repeat protein [Candidatus Riflebacteria bacterium]|nr:tetratricopeptide repeat protein [Candidatus Riflebacteria bacterium]